jgi:hypothetical protein
MRLRQLMFRCARLGAIGLVLLSLPGCSLVSFKSPEKPLTPQQLDARIRTRALSTQFISSVARSAQAIEASDDDASVLDNTLRWELAALVQSRRAATQMAPLLSLLDTWALAQQLKAFVAPGGAGGTLFGTHQGTIREICDDYAADAEEISRSVLAKAEFQQYQQFVADYARQYPLRDLNFERASVIELWSREHANGSKLVDSLGSIPEALADAAQRLQIYGETVPSEVMQETQLALRESGYSRDDLRAALARLDERMDRLTAVAETSPQLVRGAESAVRQSLREVLERLTASSRETTETLRNERVALFADLQGEREALVAAFDLQRKALATDGARVADEMIRTGGQQLRSMVGEVLLLGILLTLVLLGLPFAAGYAVGRARTRRVHGAD